MAPNRNEDLEHLIPKTPRHKQKIPRQAIKTIIIAVLICLIGLLCFVLFIQTIVDPDGRMGTSGGWTFFVFGLLALPSGSYTLYLAYKIYNECPGYYWPMLFL